MRNSLRVVSALVVFVLFAAKGVSYAPPLTPVIGTAISATGALPNANAMLDVQSPNTGDGKGLLIPRVTSNQRTNSSSSLDGGLLNDGGALRGGAAQGLLVYQTDGEQGFYYNESTTATPAWTYIGATEGVLLADGSVALTGAMNAGGNAVSNALYYGDGSGLTNIPAAGITEVDPIWTAASNAVAASIASKLSSAQWAAADSTTNYASRIEWAATNAGIQAQISSFGDFKSDGSVAMTGNLNMGGKNISSVASNISFNSDCTIIGKGATADYNYQGTAVGSGSKGDYLGSALGYQANGVFGGVSIGYQARSYYYGVAMGYQAFATNYGVAVGKEANAIGIGVAVGSSADGYRQGVAVGGNAKARDGGVALGYYANALERGIAIGFDANGITTNIAIGMFASTHDSDYINGGDRIAIGRSVTNKVENSCRIRGDLYLDGATNVMVRPTFGSGSWSTLGGGGGGISSFGYVYDLSAGSQVVAGGADVVLSNNGPLSGATHTAGTTTITVPNTGSYKIEYAISITAGIGAQMAIAVNGTVDASTCVDILVATGNISGTSILTLAAGDVLTIRNNSAMPFTTSGSPGIGAQITVTQLN